MTLFVTIYSNNGRVVDSCVAIFRNGTMRFIISDKMHRAMIREDKKDGQKIVTISRRVIMNMPLIEERGIYSQFRR